MIALPSQSAFAGKPKWETVDLGGGETFEVQITPPNYNHYLRGSYQERADELAAIRMLCVTDWRGVFRAIDENGGRAEVPFNRESLAEVMMAYPGVRQRLMELVAVFFRSQREDRAGNSPAPSEPSSAETIPEAPAASE